MNSGRTVRVSTAGDQRSLVLKNETFPSPAHDQVVVRLHAASLNFRDVALLEGKYPAKTKPDVVPLSDGAGKVVVTGNDVTRFKPGDRVAIACTAHWIGGPYLPEYLAHSVGFSTDGTLTEYGLYHESALVHLPTYMSYLEGASLPCAAVTAWTALRMGTPLLPGDTVLVQGTGGVSLFGAQFAKMLGARVLAITSSDEKAKVLKELGVDSVVNYSSTPDWEHEILALTGGKGVDRVLDIAGEKTIVKAAASTRIGGLIAVIGFASGFGGGLPPIDILTRSLTLMGSTVGPRIDFEAMLKAMEAHKTRPVIDRIYPLAEYQKAYERLKSGKMVGKVVIDLVAEA